MCFTREPGEARWLRGVPLRESGLYGCVAMYSSATTISLT